MYLNFICTNTCVTNLHLDYFQIVIFASQLNSCLNSVRLIRKGAWTARNRPVASQRSHSTTQELESDQQLKNATKESTTSPDTECQVSVSGTLVLLLASNYSLTFIIKSYRSYSILRINNMGHIFY